jgi:predicted dehydrogenase
MKTVRFGLIGCGLMGREFAAATARWCQLRDSDVRPEITAVCDQRPDALAWFQQHFSTLRRATTDCRDLLADEHVDAVYVALPHHLHAEVYCAAIRAGKHLMGEKPFGIDQPASAAISAAIAEQPAVFVRCSSEFPFFPAVQRIGRMIEEQAFGRILEVNTGLLHSSDLDPHKPVNWKRIAQFNGRYGVLGDLGMHACHVPFRASWQPQNVRAILSNVFPQRPDGHGGWTPCDTWDNATLLVETRDPSSGETFPWTCKLQRIAPGQKNTWYLEVLGTRASVRFSTRNPIRLQYLDYRGGEQNWIEVQCGHEAAFPAITGAIFEFGFGDAILQMWAAYLNELQHGPPARRFAGCVTPDEAALSHRLFTAALQSQDTGQTVAV